MNHWIRHTDLSWKKFAPVVFLISRVSRRCAATLKGSKAGAVIERGSPSAPRVYILVRITKSNDTEELLFSISIFFPNPNPETWLYGVSLSEARIQGLDSITIFPNFDPYNRDPGVFGERMYSALALFKIPRNLSWFNFFDPPFDFDREMRTEPFPRKRFLSVFTRYNSTILRLCATEVACCEERMKRNCWENVCISL